MATLQKLRNKGSLLIAFVGIALFAFIAGDIVKLFQKAPEEPTIGSVNGREITVNEFYDLRNKCEKYYSVLTGKRNLDEGDQEQITNITWEYFKKSSAYLSLAKNAGLEVTPEDVQSFIMSNNWAYWNRFAQKGTTIMPWDFIAQDGTFNPSIFSQLEFRIQEMIQSGQVSPSNINNAIEDLNDLYVAFDFFQQSIACDIVSTKLQQLYSQSAMTTNRALAERNFNLNKNTHDIEVVTYPMANYPNEKVTVSDEEIAAFYNANKDMFKVPTTKYEVVFINQEIKPTSKELDKLSNKINTYADSLRNGNVDLRDIEIFSATEVPYDGYLLNANAFGSDSIEIVKCAAGEVSAPYIDNNNNTYNVVKNIRRTKVSETIKFRSIIVYSESDELLNATVDSLLNDLKKNIKFDEVAKNYYSDTIELNTRNFINYKGRITTPEAQTKLYTAKKDVYDVLEIDENTKSIFQVMDSKGSVEVYDPFIIKRKITISADTYNKEYGKFGQFLAANKTPEKLLENETYNAQQVIVDANSANIAGIPGTRDLLRWVLGGRKAGELSEIYDYSIGNRRYMIAAAIKKITPKGYVSLDEVKEWIKFNLANEKRADLIAAEMKGKSLDELKAMENVITCKPVSDVYYKKPTFISETSADEQVISAAVAEMSEGAVSEPIKGKNGVYVIKVNAKTAKTGEFDANAEAEYIRNNRRGSGFEVENVLENAIDDNNRVHEYL